MPKTKDDDLRRAFGYDNGHYDPREFIIPAKDHQGHTERGWFHMPPPVDRALEVVLREHHFPFRTKGDVIRWCVVTGLKMLEKLEPDPGFIGRAEVVIHMCRMEEYNQTYQTMIEYLSKVVNDATTNKMTGEARRLLAEAKAEVMKIPEDEWRNRCLEDMKTRFGHLMSAPDRKAKLADGGGE